MTRVPALLVLGVVGACSPSQALTDRMREIRETIASADESGALRCAPRELALARSAVEFAKIDEAQGKISRAWAHLAVAEPNAQAALTLSPRDRCLDRVTPR
jgi:OOP family OmpA-OmpF porin